jgi:hypothetical protein
MSDRIRPASTRDESTETDQERINRNWSEILQELRVIQAGSQIITGFLLAAAFQPRFEDLDPVALAIYVSLLAVATATTIVGLTPVLLHRRLFRTGAKASLVILGSRLSTLALIGVGITLAGIVLLIVDLVWGFSIGLVAAAAALVLIAGLWIVLPARMHRRSNRP